MPSPNEFQDFGQAASAISAIAPRPSRLAGVVKLALPVLGLLGVGWVVWEQSHPKPVMKVGAAEDFHAPAFQPPQLNTTPPKLNLGRITVPPAPVVAPAPPPAPPPTVVAPPPLPVALTPPAPPADAAPVKTDNGDAARRAAAAEARKWARLAAGQVVLNNGGAAAVSSKAPGGAAAAGAAGAAATGKDTDPNDQFFNRVTAKGVGVARASRNQRTDALVAEGTIIPAVLETAVQSDLPGMLRAVTTRAIWSFDGRRVLIPAGSRLIGQYKSGIAQGQTRVFVVWTRLLRPDGVSVQLGSNGTDALGRAGNGGVVDNHYFERFGSAILLSVIGGASQFIAGLGQNNQNNQGSTTTTTVGGVTTTTTTQPNANQQNLQNARQIASQTVSQTLTSLAQQALGNQINIAPTIYLDQGARINVFVRKDLDFSALYPDPVTEALQELKHGRAGSN